MKKKPCSSIIFATDAEMREQLIGLEHQKAQTVLRFDPGSPKSLKINPLFFADPPTLDWIASFFYGPVSSSDDQSFVLFRSLLDIAVAGPNQEATLPGIYSQASLGPEGLRRLFLLRNRSEHTRFLNRFNPLSLNAQEEALGNIRRHLSFLHDSQIASSFSRAELHLPILFFDPIQLVVTVSDSFLEADKILDLIFQWTLHQILIRPSQPEDLPLYIYLKGIPVSAPHLLRVLKEDRGAFPLINRWKAASSNRSQRVFIKDFTALRVKKAAEVRRFPFLKFFSRQEGS